MTVSSGTHGSPFGTHATRTTQEVLEDPGDPWVRSSRGYPWDREPRKDRSTLGTQSSRCAPGSHSRGDATRTPGPSLLNRSGRERGKGRVLLYVWEGAKESVYQVLCEDPRKDHRLPTVTYMIQ